MYPEYLNKYSSEDSVDKPYHNSYAEVIRSQMSWTLSNPGRIAPATWKKPFDFKGEMKVTGQQMSYDEWIICQDYWTDTIPTEYQQMCDQNYPLECLDEEGGLWMEDECSPPATWKKDNMWSPRRGHQSLVHRKYGEGGEYRVGNLYVLGGRAREYARIDDSRIVGGIKGSKVATDLEHVTIREETLLKNDIWVSEDGLGVHWELVTPGCKDPQLDILQQFEVWSPRDETLDIKNVGAKPIPSPCEDDSDCYGQARCLDLQGTHRTCVCPMWSPRENHATSVQHVFSKVEEGNMNVAEHSEDYMYVVGGFVSVRRSFCGELLRTDGQPSTGHSCGSSNSYRYYIDDAWVSNDAVNWVQFKQAFDAKASFTGRGAHAMSLISRSVFKDLGDDCVTGIECEKYQELWIFGGETGNNEDQRFLNDGWYVELPSEPCCARNGDCGEEGAYLKLTDLNDCLPKGRDWKMAFENAAWEPRSGHTVVVEPPNSKNTQLQRLFLVGGNDGEQVFDDVWSWGDDQHAPVGEHGDFKGTLPWLKDYSSTMWYRQGAGDLLYFGPENANHPEGPKQPAPQQYYLYEKSDIRTLQRIYLPGSQENLKLNTDWQQGGIFEEVPERVTLMTDDEMAQIRSVGINTLEDLVNAETLTIVRLRGYDYPQVEEKDLLSVHHICDLKALAAAVLDKCSLVQLPNYEGEEQMPWNLDPTYGGPLLSEEDPNAKWHGKLYNVVEEECDVECQVDNWDGCDIIDGLESSSIDIEGIGKVELVEEIRDPSGELQELKCRQSPMSRTKAAGVLLQDNVIILGGKETLNNGPFLRDVWMRDDHLPRAVLKGEKPGDETDETLFEFDSNEAAAHIFEYKVFDSGERREALGWTITTGGFPPDGGADLSWLDSRGGGPGGGTYILYVRAIDPAGNVDSVFGYDNMHAWVYVPPLPWDLIIAAICGFLVLVMGLYFNYRRLKKKRAMERYAIKRMRRKFKGQAKGDDKKGQDWRQLAADDEKGDKKKKKKKKKKKDKDKKKKKGLKDRQEDKKKDKKKKKKKDKDGKSKDKDKKKKDKDKKKKKDKDGKFKDKDKKKKSSKEKDKNKKSSKEKDKDKKSSKEKDKEKKHTKEGDKERKKEK